MRVSGVLPAAAAAAAAAAAREGDSSHRGRCGLWRGCPLLHPPTPAPPTRSPPPGRASLCDRFPRIVHGGLTAAIIDESYGGLLFALKKAGALRFWGPAYTGR